VLFVSEGAVKSHVGTILTPTRPEQPRPDGRPGTRWAGPGVSHSPCL